MNSQKKRIELNNEMLKLNKKFLEHQEAVGRLYMNEANNYMRGNFEATPIGETGGSFSDFLNGIKDVASLPFQLLSMPLQVAKKALTGGKAPKKTRSRKAKCEDGAGVFDFLKKEAKFASKGIYDVGKKHGMLEASASPVVASDTPPAVFNNTPAGSGKPRKPRAKKGGADNYDSSLTQPKVIKFQNYESVPAATASNKMKVPVEKKPVLKAYKPKGGSLLSTLSDIANIMPSVFPTELDNWIPPEVTRGIAKKIAEKASGGSETGGAKKAKRNNPWLEYVRGISHQHPEMKYKDVLILAKKTYRSPK